jgi:hypothetical protein
MFKSVILKQRPQILRFIERMYQNGSEFEVWQGREGLHIQDKNLALGQISKLQLLDNKMFIEPKFSEFNFDVTDGKHLYFHNEYKDFLFKSKIVEVAPQEIKVDIPGEAQIVDERKFMRKVFTHYEHRFVEFSSYPRNPQKDTIVKRRLYDISEGGMAFSINRHEVFRYQNTEYILINGEHINSDSDRIGRICHVTGIMDSLTGKTNFRVGVEFMTNGY